jgi:hypothetical protein
MMAHEERNSDMYLRNTFFADFPLRERRRCVSSSEFVADLCECFVQSFWKYFEISGRAAVVM